MTLSYSSADPPKRFYVSVDCAAADGGFAVRLDGRIPRSPEGKPLVLPTAALAQMIAEEWCAQDKSIRLATMPATRLAWTALDRIPAARAEVASEVANYAASDLLCYFADEPDALAQRQESLWAPLLNWARTKLQLDFQSTRSLLHAPQSQATLQAVRDLAAAEGDFGLAGLAFAAALFGSAILAFALRRGVIAGEGAFQLSRLEAAFQEERWGVDEEAAARTRALEAEARMAELWFHALDAG